LAVWSGNASGPQGNPIYEEFNQTPAYLDSINKFKTYRTDPIYLGPGIWYVGFIQNNAVLLNIGLDVNTPADPSKKYFNTSGTWTQSQLPGMWMIRPVFSGEPLYTGVGNADFSPGLSVFPNPAQDHVTITYPDGFGSATRLDLTDVSGRLVRSIPGKPDYLSLSELRSGLYFVRLTDRASGNILTVRLVVSPK
jgi:hypothetical protein